MIFPSFVSLGKSEAPVGGTSLFLGDPPPDPRFLASLGVLSLGYSSITVWTEHPRSEAPVSKSALPTTARRAKREDGGLGEDPPGSPMSHLHPRGSLGAGVTVVI